jgi:hypothetical protein
MADYEVCRQVIIRKTDENGLSFMDAICYTDAEFATKSESDIQKEVDARFDAWKEMKKPVVDTRSPEEVLAEEVALFAEAKAQAQSTLDAITAIHDAKAAELDGM